MEKLEKNIREKLENKKPNAVRKIGFKIFKISAKRFLKKEKKKNINERDIISMEYCQEILDGIKNNDDELIESGLRGMQWLK